MTSARSSKLAAIEDAVAAIARGEIVVVVDDEDRENEGDLIMAAEFATPEKIAFFVKHTSGVICMPLTPERCDDLDLPLMVSHNTESHRTAFTVSVDFRHGTTTGISAGDRARTIQALIEPGTGPGDLARPGHIFPLPTAKVACSTGPVTPRRPSTWRAWPVSIPPACCARSSTTTGRWRASPTSSRSARSTTC